MKKLVKSVLEYLLAFLIILFLLLAIVGVVVVKFYGDDLKDYAVELVNDAVDTKITTDEISVKVFHRFPNTSIVVSNLTVYSSHNFDVSEFPHMGADTLLTARSASISFNLLGMIRKKFNIRQVDINQGELRLLTDSRGQGNYRLIAQKEENNRRDRGTSVDISRLRISEFSLHQENLAKELIISASAVNLDLNGRYARQNTQIRGNLKGKVEEISNKGIRYASDLNTGLRINLDFRDSLFTVKNGQINLDRIQADVDGSYRIMPGKGGDINLVAAARNMEIHEVLDLLPGELSQSLKEIRGNGILQLYTRINGRVSSTLTPSIKAEFETTNANLNWSRLPFSMKNLNLSGSYSNGGRFNPVTTTLSLETFSASIGKDHFTGKARIHNFYDPDFSLELKGDLHPRQWLNWYPRIPLHEAGGSLIPDLKVKGSYDRLKPKGLRFVNFDVNGGVALENLLVRIRKDGTALEGLTGTVFIENDLWKPAIEGSFGSTDFNIEGSGLNLISYFLKKEEKLVASAEFRSNHLDLQEILDELPSDGSGRKKAFLFPNDLDLKLNLVIRDFEKGVLKASNVRGVAHYDAPFFFVDDLNMQSMDGTLSGSFGLVQDSEKNIFSTVDAKLYSLDISKLFLSFNNFGQQQLTPEHLKGTISGNTAFSANFDSTFTIIPSTILSDNEINIQNGELNEFTPIMALSRFIEVEELRNIRFNTLKNTIIIRDNQVIIPVMDIQSNAMDLSASGNHAFNNHYEYRLRLKLSDLLYGKARRSKNSEFIIEQDVDDTRILFLRIHDQGQGAKVEMDREKAGQKIREDLKKEKSEMKRILNEELGLFKRQADSLNTDTEEKQPGLRFEFSEDEEGDSTNRKDKTQTKRRSLRRTKKDTAQNKPVEKFVIDE